MTWNRSWHPFRCGTGAPSAVTWPMRTQQATRPRSLPRSTPRSRWEAQKASGPSPSRSSTPISSKRPWSRASWFSRSRYLRPPRRRQRLIRSSICWKATKASCRRSIDHGRCGRYLQRGTDRPRERGPTSIRAKKAEQVLVGKKLTDALFEKAGEAASRNASLSGIFTHLKNTDAI